MKTLLLTFGIFLLGIIGIAVGYIFSKRTIKGSCGPYAKRASGNKSDYSPGAFRLPSVPP